MVLKTKSNKPWLTITATYKLTNINSSVTLLSQKKIQIRTDD